MEQGSETARGDPSAAFAEVKQRAAAGLEDIKEGARERAEEVGAEVGAHARVVAAAIRSASERLRGKEDWLADAADGLSRGLEKFSAMAREKGFSGLKQDVERVARERPVLFMGTAIAVGMALGRVLRSAPPSLRAAEAATATGRDQYGPGAGWPSAPDAEARPSGGAAAGEGE